MSKEIEVFVTGPSIEEINISLMRNRDFSESCKKYIKGDGRVEFIVNNMLQFLACINSVKRNDSTGKHWILEGRCFGSNFRSFICYYDSYLKKGKMILNKR